MSKNSNRQKGRLLVQYKFGLLLRNCSQRILWTVVVVVVAVAVVVVRSFVRLLRFSMTNHISSSAATRVDGFSSLACFSSSFFFFFHIYFGRGRKNVDGHRENDVDDVCGRWRMRGRRCDDSKIKEQL